MNPKIEHLHVHKNTREQRKRKELRKTLVSHARTMSQDPDIAGYVLITWNSQATPNTAWRTPEDGPVPGNLLPAYAMSALTRKLTLKDVKHHLDDED